MLTLFANIASVVSLGLALWTLYQTRKVKGEVEVIRDRYLLLERAPGLIKQLERYASTINLHISTAHLESHELAALLRACSATAKNLQSKLEEGDARTRSANMHTSIENALQRPAVGRDRLQGIYAEAAGLIEATRGLLEDHRKEV